jgi:hypothetical protein
VEGQVCKHFLHQILWQHCPQWSIFGTLCRLSTFSATFTAVAVCPAPNLALSSTLPSSFPSIAQAVINLCSTSKLLGSNWSKLTA